MRWGGGTLVWGGRVFGGFLGGRWWMGIGGGRDGEGGEDFSSLDGFCKYKQD